MNYFQGLPYQWILKTIVHKIDGDVSDTTVFLGKISSREFGLELFKNTIIGYEAPKPEQEDVSTSE